MLNIGLMYSPKEKKALGSAHEVHQSADWVDSDANLVSLEQCERVWWNDSRSGQKKAAVREGVVSVEIFDQCVDVTFHAVERSCTGKNLPATTANFKMNLSRGRQWCWRDQKAGTKGTTAVVNLGLW